MPQSELHLVWTWPVAATWSWMCECGEMCRLYSDQASALSAAHGHSLAARNSDDRRRHARRPPFGVSSLPSSEGD